MRAISSRILMAGAVLGLAVGAAGCTSIKDHRGYIVDRALVDSIQPGIDNQGSVEKTLGRPTFVSQFGSKDWYYVSRNTATNAFQKPKTYEQMVLRVRFDEAGNVAGVDQRGVEQIAQISPEGQTTPTLGRHRSFLQDLFGNVGAVGAGGVGGVPTGPGPNGS
jgi:outer membrane protein assembly factor BamE (lipoprotein component of BamABCDE complex)